MSVAAVLRPADYESRLQRYLFERAEEGRAVRVGEKEISERAEIVARYAELFTRQQLVLQFEHQDQQQREDAEEGEPDADLPGGIRTRSEIDGLPHQDEAEDEQDAPRRCELQEQAFQDPDRQMAGFGERSHALQTLPVACADIEVLQVTDRPLEGSLDPGFLNVVPQRAEIVAQRVEKARLV